ncbi:MAG: hypothetical protein ABFD23_02975 [Caldisericales bacterium]|nr:hypothetical protein [Caldisericia bacterium]MCE5177400.1 hypothetical protein [bacterium]
MNNFWTRTWQKMLRHVAGLLGVGAAFVVSIYFSLFLSEIIMAFSFKNPPSLTKSILSFINLPTTPNIITVALFLVFWMFIAAPALAGAYRFLIGTVDPKHIAQRTFINGIVFYTKRMFSYTSFLVLLFSLFLGAMYGLQILMEAIFVPQIAINWIYLVMLILAYMVLTKFSYAPVLIISGEGIFRALKRSWVATSRRFWAIFGIRLLILFISIFPVLLVYFTNFTVTPSMSLWPYFFLMSLGFEEFIMIRGLQEWEEERNLPIISPQFFDRDLRYLEVYIKQHDYDYETKDME